MNRRALLLAGLACWAGARAADVPSAPAMARLHAAIKADVRQALMLMRTRQWLAAASLLQGARTHIDNALQDGWPLRAYVLPPLGACLLALQQPEQARVVLTQAQEAERRIAAGEAGAPMVAILDGQRKGFAEQLLKVEFLRQMLGEVASPTENAALPVEDLLHDVRLGAHNHEIPLVRALAALRQRDALQALYASASWPAPAADANADAGGALPPHTGDEFRAVQYGQALTALGCGDLAAQALGTALALNWQRCIQLGTFVPSFQAHAGAFAMRRLLLGLSLGVCFEQAPARARLPTDVLVARLLESKGLGLRHGAQLRALMAASSSPALQQAHEALQRQEAQLYQDMSQGAPIQTVLMAQLGQAQALTQALPALRELGLAQVFVPGEQILAGLRRLPAGTACLGYARYRPQAADGHALAAPRYARWVLAAGQLALTDLGPSQAIDADVLRLRTLINDGTRADPLARQRALARLSSQLLSELPEAAVQATRWYIEPDGALSLLPFEVLSVRGERPLIDHCCISLVSTFAHLVQAQTAEATGPACIVANPAYGKPVDVDPKANVEGKAVPQAGGDQLAAVREHITPLPETAQEARAVKEALQAMGHGVQLFEAQAATPAAFAFSQAPRVLHVAAHGLMLDAGAAPALSDAGQEMLSMILPGRSSALALASQGGVSLLYGADLMQLNLRGTALVVLSACDTGNGRIEHGEGIDSLRRALEVAGARATLTSLWPVPSQATVHLMRAFYRELAGGQGVAQALRSAKLALRQRYPGADAWAAFVAAGQT
jgi:CHAT domain-containing protein